MNSINSIVALVATVLVSMIGTAIAQEPGKLAPLPDKLPASVEARVGKVEFDRGLPTKKGIEQLFEIQDFQRATQGLDHGVGHPRLPIDHATALQHRRQGACEDSDVMLRSHTWPRPSARPMIASLGSHRRYVQ